jgi:hypothetical protein
MAAQKSTPPRLHPGIAAPVVPIERVRPESASPTPAATGSNACGNHPNVPTDAGPTRKSRQAPAGNAAGLPPGASFDDMLALYRDSTKSLREPVKHIIERVACKHGMLPAHITGDQRAKHFVKARYAAIAEVRRIYPEKSLPWLGRQFNRDHTTILHALRKLDMYP